MNGLAYRPVSRPALTRLQAHGWRGNVRELENILHRAVLLAGGEEIETDAIELGSDGGRELERQPDMAVVGGIGDGVAGLVGRRMEEVERDLILQTLGHTLGNRTHAAVLLGISIRALRNKLRDYATQGVPVPPPAGGIGPSGVAA